MAVYKNGQICGCYNIPKHFDASYFENFLLPFLGKRLYAEGEEQGAVDEIKRWLINDIFKKKNRCYSIPSKIIRTEQEKYREYDDKRVCDFQGIIENYFIQDINPDKKIMNCFFSSYKLDILDMGGLKFITRNPRGRENKRYKDNEESLPGDCIFPTKAGGDDKHMLKIPSDLAKELNIECSCKETYFPPLKFQKVKNKKQSKEKWLLGTVGSNIDTIFLFYVGRIDNLKEPPEIRCMFPVLYQDETEYRQNFSASNIYIWDELVDIYNKDSQFYFDIPQIFFKIYDSDHYFCKKNRDGIELPAFYGFEDGLRNFVFFRLSYSSPVKHNNGFYIPIKLSLEGPSEVSIHCNSNDKPDSSEIEPSETAYSAESCHLFRAKVYHPSSSKILPFILY